MAPDAPMSDAAEDGLAAAKPERPAVTAGQVEDEKRDLAHAVFDVVAEHVHRGLPQAGDRRDQRASGGGRRGVSGRAVGAVRPFAVLGPLPRRGHPAAVTNNGRTEVPRSTGTTWIAVWKADLATPITGMPNSACACAPRPDWPPGSRSA